MPNYDFKPLSSFDFEQLVRDLLQKELGLHLESFKQGRDHGIDLRFCEVTPRLPGLRRDLIVQCKHYASTPFSKLKHHLEHEELPKVARLKPARYILATSVGLTPQNKQDLAQLLSPYCLGTTDILGMDDLNNLLGKFPELETTHFKLWLTSVPVMSRVLHSKLFNESNVARERIVERMRVYVANQSFVDAKRILDGAHYCVIVGVPGIGKTTLAEALIVDYLARDYEVFVLSNDIRDAFAVHDSTRKQLFYYDDFLGQTGAADKLQKNEDLALIKFVEATQSSGLTRLVLSTRDYIFNQAKLTYERIAHSRLDQQRCVVDLAAYTKWDRAKILFNHVYFSSLPSPYKAAILEGRGYRRILEHPNFSPRIVAWMTDLSVHHKTPPGLYLEEFLRNLNHPLRLWEHAYNNQLSNASRHLLLCLASLPNPVRLDDLVQAFDAMFTLQAKRYGFAGDANDFQRSIKECEANFVSVSASSGTPTILVATFHNPSIRDFLYDYLETNSDFVRATCDGAFYFEQVQRLWAGFARDSNGKATKSRTRAWLEANPEHLWQALDRTFRRETSHVLWNEEHTQVYRSDVSYEGRVIFAWKVAETAFIPESRSVIGGMVDFVHARLKQGRCDLDDLNRLLTDVKWDEIDADVTAAEFVGAAKKAIGIGGDEIPDYLERDFDEYGAVIEFAQRHADVVSVDERQQLQDLFRERVGDYEPDRDFEQIELVAEQIENIASTCSMDLSDDISRLRQRATELREEAEARSDDDYDRWRDDRALEEDEGEEEVDNMFDSLR